MHKNSLKKPVLVVFVVCVEFLFVCECCCCGGGGGGGCVWISFDLIEYDLNEIY